MSNLKGKLIVIDGIDGSGKATQTKILVQRLKAENIKVESMDFPRYQQNFFGGLVRQYLDGKFGKATEVDPRLASILYALDRFESSPKINQWLTEGKIVILDRYHTSNLIHQGAKLDEKELDEFATWLAKVEFDKLQIPRPDLVIYLHLSAEVALDLITKRGNGHDGHDTIEHLKKAEQRCLYLAKKLNWLTIECFDNNQIRSKEEIAEDIFKKITQVIDNPCYNCSN